MLRSFTGISQLLLALIIIIIIGCTVVVTVVLLYWGGGTLLPISGGERELASYHTKGVLGKVVWSEDGEYFLAMAIRWTYSQRAQTILFRKSGEVVWETPSYQLIGAEGDIKNGVVVVEADNNITVYDLRGNIINFISLDNLNKAFNVKLKSISSVSLSPNGKIIGVFGTSSVFFIGINGRPMGKCNFEHLRPAVIDGARWFPTGEHVCHRISYQENEMHFVFYAYNPITQRERTIIDIPTQKYWYPAPVSVYIDWKDGYVAIALTNKTVFVLDPSFKIIGKFTYDADIDITSISPGGKYLATGLKTGYLVIHDLSTGEKKVVKPEDTNVAGYYFISWSGDSKLVAATYGSKMIKGGFFVATSNGDIIMNKALEPLSIAVLSPVDHLLVYGEKMDIKLMALP